MKFFGGNALIAKLRIQALALACTILAACAQTGPIADNQKAVLYPPLPQQPRLQFLTMIKDENSIGASDSRLDKFLIGTNEDVNELGRPLAVAHDKGVLYVLDNQYNAVVRINLETGKFGTLFGALNEKFVWPTSIAVGAEGQLYVTDQRLQTVFTFDKTGTPQQTYQFSGQSRPVDVIEIGDSLFVTDLFSYEIHVLDKVTGELLETISGSGTDYGLLNKPTHLAKTANDEILVTDSLNARAQLLDQDGGFIKVFGRLGVGPGALVRPKGLDVDRDGNMYIADSAFGMVNIYDTVSGSFRMSFGKQGTGYGSLYAPNDVRIDYDNVEYFRKFAHPDFELEYIVYVANALVGINVYGFGSWTGPLEADEEQASDEGWDQRPRTLIKSVEELGVE